MLLFPNLLLRLNATPARECLKSKTVLKDTNEFTQENVRSDVLHAVNASETRVLYQGISRKYTPRYETINATYVTNGLLTNRR